MDMDGGCAWWMWDDAGLREDWVMIFDRGGGSSDGSDWNARGLSRVDATWYCLLPRRLGASSMALGSAAFEGVHHCVFELL